MYLGWRHTDYVNDQTTRSRQLSGPHRISRTNEGNLPNSGHRRIQMYSNVFADMLINFRGQKIEGEGQGHRRQ